MSRQQTLLLIVIVLVAVTFVRLWSVEPPRFRSRTVTGAIVDAGEYANIQQAIAALPRAGGTVRIPPGRYRIDLPLQIHSSDIRLEGAGAITVLENYDEGGLNAIYIGPPHFDPNKPPELDVRPTRVELVNFRVTGIQGSGPAIIANYANQLLIQNVIISGHSGAGIQLYQAHEGVRINNCWIRRNGGAGIYVVGSMGTVIANCSISDNYEGIVAEDARHLTISGNSIDNHIGAGVSLLRCNGANISANSIGGGVGVGLALDGASRMINVAANNIFGNAGGGGYVIDARDCTFSANVLAAHHGPGLSLGPAASAITVTGNTFSGQPLPPAPPTTFRVVQPDELVDTGRPPRPVPSPAPSAGILLDGATDITVTGNTFTRLDRAVESGDNEPQRIVFTGNLISDAEPGTESLKDTSGNVIQPSQP